MTTCPTFEDDISVVIVNMNCIYKRVVMETFIYLYAYGNHHNDSQGPIRTMYDTCSKYGVLQFVIESITNGYYVSKLEWKKKVKRVIWKRERYMDS